MEVFFGLSPDDSRAGLYSLYTELGISQVIASLPDSVGFLHLLDLGMATSVSIRLAESVCLPRLCLQTTVSGVGWLSFPPLPFYSVSDTS